MNVWTVMAGIILQMDVLNFEAYVGLCAVDKNVEMLFLTVTQVSY
jgi:hypothetical protein